MEPNESNRDGFRSWWTRRLIFSAAGICVLAFAAFLLRGGCPDVSSSANRTTQANPEDEQAQLNQLLTFALHQLNRMEEYEAGEAFAQAMDRLDQWVQAQKPSGQWNLDPMAAPLFEAFSASAVELKPVREQLAAPRTLLELKAIARQLENVPERLDDLSRRRRLEDLESLRAHFEQVNKEIETSIKQAGDAGRQNEIDSRILENFFKRLRDPRKEARFKNLATAAQMLDDPERLKEFLKLAELGQGLQALLEQPNPQELEQLAALHEETALRILRGAPRTKLMIELRFVLDQMRDLGRMKDYVELQALTWVLDNLAGQLKATADRASRDDLRDLAIRFAAAGKKRDLDDLRGLRKELEAMARPRDLADLNAMAPQLADAANRLAHLARQADQQAKATGLEGLATVGQYAGKLAEALKLQADQAHRFSADPGEPAAKTAQQLGEMTAQFNDLAGRVEMLAEEMEHLASFEKQQFFRRDRSAFQEAIYFRDLSHWIAGEEPDDLSRAKRIFDWTVRNVQLDDDRRGPAELTPRVPQTPLETLLLGHGTPQERAWVFILLARQQGIDVALLAVEEGQAGPAKGLRPWALAVLAEGELYLFEPALGVPSPAKDGIRRGTGGLDIRPATLAAVAADEGLLRQFDAGKQAAFPLKASEVQKVVVLLEGSPSYLSHRMKLVEGQLQGEDRMALAASPAAQAVRFKTCKHVADVRLWTLPYDTLLGRALLGPETVKWQARAQAPFFVASLVPGQILSEFSDEPEAPLFWEANPSPSAKQRRQRTMTERRREAPLTAPLGKGRVLHLKGKFGGDLGAVHFYQMARPSERELAAFQELPAQRRALFLQAKQNASYWLGLIAFDQGNYTSATDYFTKRTLEAFPVGTWTSGARYNLGRVYEAQGRTLQAIQQYRAAAEQLDGHGNLLRARWLETLSKAGDAKRQAAPNKPADTLPDLPILPDLPGLKSEPSKNAPQGNIEPPKTPPSKG